MIKKSFVFFFLIYTSVYLYSQNQIVWLSLKIPVHYGIVNPEGYSPWNGYVLGITAAGELVKNNAFTSFEYEISVINEEYNLPEEDFFKNSFISITSLKNSFNLKFYPKFSQLFFGIGIEFITQLNGKFGDSTMVKTIDTEYLGTDTYLTLKTGYFYKINESLSMPIEFKFIYDLTVKKSTVINVGLNAGIAFKIGI